MKTVVHLSVNVLSFCLLLVLWRCFDDGVIFYQGLLLCVILAACNYYLFRRSDFILEKTLLIFFVLYSFNITVPALLDRSISYYIIGLTANEDGVGLEKYRHAFYKGFILNNGAIEKRLDEQKLSGNIICFEDKCRLTSRGAFIFKMNLFLTKVLNLDSRYVSPENYN